MQKLFSPYLPTFGHKNPKKVANVRIWLGLLMTFCCYVILFIICYDITASHQREFSNLLIFICVLLIIGCVFGIVCLVSGIGLRIKLYIHRL